ncbi:MAG: helix-turn-helix domain-containing protein [Candidatus Micrarchaeota archaeon]|nr:helix-turn-helix domain-containing protein [Candidatus Micrarchaeota archaeon]
MDFSQLVSLGLTAMEAQTYIALLELGNAKAGAISKKTGVNRTTTYDALERLVQKGLVAYSSEGEHKVFSAVPPVRLVEWLEEKKELANAVIPELEGLVSKEVAPVVKIYRGKKGINSLLSQMLRFKEYVSFGASGQFWEVMQHDYYAFQRKKKKLNVKSRVLLPETTRKSEPTSAISGGVRFLPRELFSPATTWVYGDSVAIVTWTNPPLAVVISDKNVSHAYKNYFEALWKMAKS